MLALSKWKRALAAASLANISLMRIWSEILTFTRSDSYTMKLPPSSEQYAAVIVLLVLLTAMFWALLLWAEKSEIGRVVFMLTLAIPLNAIREVSSHSQPYLRGELIRHVSALGILSGTAIIGILTFAAVMKWSDRVYRGAVACSLIIAPFIAVTLLQGVLGAMRYDDAVFRDRPGMPRFTEAPKHRVVWIIFDEMDQRLAFEQTPGRVNLPEFMRIRDTSLYATAAYSPSSSTLSSIPSLLTGKFVEFARPAGADDLRIKYMNSRQEVSWSKEATVFSRAREMGVNTAVVGWYHPYCRVLPNQLTSCWWSAMPMQADSVGRSFDEATPKYLRTLFETSLLSPFGQSLSTQEATERLKRLLQQATRVAADASMGLVFLHVQAPHAPHAYDRRSRDFTLYNSPIHGYLDSLELADMALGQIRRAMESAGVWDTTNVLISSDHSYRSASALNGGKTDRRIPFLLKLAGQHEGAAYEPRFNSVLSADLVTTLLRNDLSTVDQVREWVRTRGATFTGFWRQTITE